MAEKVAKVVKAAIAGGDSEQFDCGGFDQGRVRQRHRSSSSPLL
jgi:hypothetical protein